MLHKTLKCMPRATWAIVVSTVQLANGQAVYWAQLGTPSGIYLADLGGSNVELVIPVAWPTALALDARGGKVNTIDGSRQRMTGLQNRGIGHPVNLSTKQAKEAAFITRHV